MVAQEQDAPAALVSGSQDGLRHLAELGGVRAGLFPPEKHVRGPADPRTGRLSAGIADAQV